jgi:hypothetical protein
MITRSERFQQHLDKCTLCGKRLALCAIGKVLLQLVSEEGLRKIGAQLKKRPIAELAKSRAAMGFLAYLRNQENFNRERIL